MSAPVDVLAVMDAMLPENYDEALQEPTRAACKDLREARAAVAELVALARKLRLDREGIENTHERFCAPVLDVADVRAFTAALAKLGGAR